MYVCVFLHVHTVPAESRRGWGVTGSLELCDWSSGD